jgi:HEAT repeat protein
LRGPKIDSAIVAGIRSTGGKAKAELIMAAGERGSTAAADDLMRAVSDPDPDVHRSSLRALRGVSGAPQIPELLGLVLNARSASDRREASQALTAVLKRSQVAHIKPVLSAYRSAPQPEARASLLEVMGQTSNPEALPLLRDSLKENRAEVARAAILALSEWSDAAPLADLLAAAKDNSDPTLQVLALRGYLKLMGAPSPRPHSESAGMLAGAMRLAKQPAEKKTILSLLVSIPCAEALEIAEQSLADETVATESKVAVKRIRSALNR